MFDPESSFSLIILFDQCEWYLFIRIKKAPGVNRGRVGDTCFWGLDSLPLEGGDYHTAFFMR